MCLTPPLSDLRGSGAAHAAHTSHSSRALHAVSMVAAVLGLASVAAHAEPAPIAPIAPIVPIDASPRFELIDRGDAVEVIAHHVKAARTAVLPIRSRLGVAISGTPEAKRLAPNDATVKLIEIDTEDAIRVLSVKLGFERGDVKALSRFAQAIQVGDDLHLLVPRKLPANGVAPRLPEPTMPAMPSPAAPVPAALAVPAAPPARVALPGPVAPVLGPSPDPRSALPPALADPAPAAARPADGSARHDATLGATATRPRSAADALSAAPAAPPRVGYPSGGPPVTSGTRSLDHALVADRGDPWSRISMYGALGLAAVGAGIWLLRRRRTRLGPATSIEVIAQRSLGGKARIVWLSVGSREMIVSVTAQQVRMLSQWRKTDTPATLPAAYTTVGGEVRDVPLGAKMTGPIAVSSTDKPMSPAVSGLLRLRGRTGQMPADAADDITSDVQADELWAKEILAATAAHPGGRS